MKNMTARRRKQMPDGDDLEDLSEKLKEGRIKRNLGLNGIAQFLRVGRHIPA
jgi:hypothetical protein